MDGGRRTKKPKGLGRNQKKGWGQKSKPGEKTTTVMGGSGKQNTKRAKRKLRLATEKKVLLSKWPAREKTRYRGKKLEERSAQGK